MIFSTFLDSPHYQTLLLIFSTFTIVDFGTLILSSLKNAEKTAGPIKHEPRIGRICTIVHGAGTFGTRAFLLGIYGFNILFEQNLLVGLSLPNHPAKYQIQLVAIFADIFAAFIIRGGIKTLGTNLAHIGTRDRSPIVTSGPFKYMRHPMYHGFLLCALSNLLVFWNWVPLTYFPCILPAIIFKIPIEEGLILEDPNVRDDYKRYQKNVRWRLFPGIW